MRNEKEKKMKKAFNSAIYTLHGIISMSKEASSEDRIAEVMGEYLSREGVEVSQEEIKAYVSNELKSSAPADVYKMFETPVFNDKENKMKSAFKSASYNLHGIMSMSKEASSADRIAEVMGEYLSREGVEVSQEEIKAYVTKELEEQKKAIGDIKEIKMMK